jgi:hypothetical protein
MREKRRRLCVVRSARSGGTNTVFLIFRPPQSTQRRLSVFKSIPASLGGWQRTLKLFFQQILSYALLIPRNYRNTLRLISKISNALFFVATPNFLTPETQTPSAIRPISKVFVATPKNTQPLSKAQKGRDQITRWHILFQFSFVCENLCDCQLPQMNET